jgi:hypothetical protein
MHVARLSIDLMGAVPMVPLEPLVKVVREGKRVQLIELALAAGGRSWVRASALRIRLADTPPLPAALTVPFPCDAVPRGHGWFESLVVRCEAGGQGPGAWWIRFLANAVEGEVCSPLERVAMTADFGSGTAAPASRVDWTLANLDIAVHLTRAPRGEWLLLDSTSETAGNGIGLVHNRLGDCDGMIGGGYQTIFVDRWQRPNPFT